MKKLIALILVCLLTFGVVASAESINIDNLTHEELLSLHNQITLNLFGEALVNGIELPQGQYEIGVDIPAGSYVITFCGERISGSVEIFEIADGESVFFDDIDSEENVPLSMKVTVKEGQLLEVDVIHSQGTVTIKTWSSFLAF